MTAKTGPNKGASWAITAKALVLGRGTICDVVIADPMVSRRHCEIYQVGSEVHLTDLGSSNTTLVNGAPIKECVLNIGDEIALGRVVFMVTGVNPASAQSVADTTEARTLSLSEGEALYLTNKVEEAMLQGRPKTVQDMSTLFAIARSLSRTTTVTELVDTLTERLIERFHPMCAWMARYHQEDDDLVFYSLRQFPACSSTNAPTSTMIRTLRDQRAMLTPTKSTSGSRKSLVTTLVAPMSVGGEMVAVVTLQTQTPQSVYDDTDLEFLIAVAYQAAPFFHTVEQVERLRRDNERLRQRAGESTTMVGVSKSIGHVRGLIQKAARSDLNVLILGETGTGKELAARMIHEQSSRGDGPFIIVNCAAIPKELFESELFGYEKGAFTGATQRRIGWVEQAHGGTLFLDEVGDLSLDNQARILRVIELGTFHRVGAETESHVDIRVVAATNRDLGIGVSDGTFRQDLYHRLNGFEIHIPPLRERPSDVPVLADHFFQLGLNRAKRPLTGIDPETLEYLASRPWSGNVRELRSSVNRAIALARSGMLVKEDFATGSGKAEEIRGEILSLAAVERQHITKVLGECGRNISQAARVLEISRNTLYNKISEYGIEV
ncbi:MAG: sigma 54-interacting transcriptional regulator [Candidatus Hydrogenedentes bacterium]|nr:sigma 54-interacting transcriptional regulator [Candidatus Hydrogenedentota bacterium]